MDALGTIPKGATFSYNPGRYEELHPAWIEVQDAGVSSASGPIRREVAEAIEAGSRIKDKLTFKDIMGTHGLSARGGVSEEVVQHLMDSGKLSAEDINAAIIAICGE